LHFIPLRPVTALVLGAWCALVPALATQPLALALAAPTEGFAADPIRAVWERGDGPVASGRVSRPWVWGPGPFYTTYEPFDDAPNGSHLVQYFDKGRLEINDPGADPRSPWYVTGGLLVAEMVSGEVSVGGGRSYRLGPAQLPVAGDAYGSLAPTYATFTKLTGRQTDRTGQTVDGLLSTSGQTRTSAGALRLPVQIQLVRFEQATGHNWAGVFWSFAGSPARPNWLHVLGYPITEPYWVHVPVNGMPQYVLVQLFQRRVLTYVPTNPPGWQVEMGNVGRHYYLWRYANLHTARLHTRYQVQVAIGPAPRRTTTVREMVEFTNNTGGPLGAVVLRTVWRHRQGVFDLQAVTVGGAQATTRWLNGINLEVRLPDAVPPGGRVSFELAFRLNPRPVGGRSAYDPTNDILSLGDMLPTVVPWENGGWSHFPYSELGDHGYYDTAHYVVDISSTAGERLVVGGSGRLDFRSADLTRWRFVADNVRDVAYVVSPRFVDPLTDTSMARTVQGVKILAYFLPEHRAAAQRQLELVAPALAWFSRQLGPYPFDTFTVAEMGVPVERTDMYAQEYPMVYLIPTQWLGLATTPGMWTWHLPVHETAHQWFYSTVGSNQLTDPWLDEAVVTYLTAEYVRYNFPALYDRVWAGLTDNADTSRPVSSGVFSGFANENHYTNTIYDGGALMLDRVRRAMGADRFYAALRDYYAALRFARARPADLMNALQKHSPADLKPIFSQYLGY
jgi:hypothetical protein